MRELQGNRDEEDWLSHDAGCRLTQVFFQQNLFYFVFAAQEMVNTRVERKIPFILTKHTFEWTKEMDTTSSHCETLRQTSLPSPLFLLRCHMTQPSSRKSPKNASERTAASEPSGCIAIGNGMLMYSSVQGQAGGQRATLWGASLIHTVALARNKKRKNLRKSTISNKVSKTPPVIK